jgi:hypothetical protein
VTVENLPLLIFVIVAAPDLDFVSVRRVRSRKVNAFIRVAFEEDRLLRRRVRPKPLLVK